jgi:hypothetical protein
MNDIRSSTGGYDRYYHFDDVCNQSEECISVYRIGDGSKDCHDGMDEKQSFDHFKDSTTSISMFNR